MHQMKVSGIQMCAISFHTINITTQIDAYSFSTVIRVACFFESRHVRVLSVIISLR